MHRRDLLRRAVRLAGFAGLSPALLLALEGCREEAVRTLSPDQFRLLSGYCDQLLPRTTTLGALDVGVPEFVDRMLTALLTEAERNPIMRMLEVQLSEGNDRLNALPEEVLRPIKRLAVLGYFTSEAVMTGQLNFHPAPGHYDGCAGADRLFVNLNFGAE
jgi:hypothetical protein